MRAGGGRRGSEDFTGTSVGKIFSSGRGAFVVGCGAITCDLGIATFDRKRFRGDPRVSPATLPRPAAGRRKKTR